MRHPIDWALFGRAADFYTARGYRYVEVPWAVRRAVTLVTVPSHISLDRWAAGHGDLIGSAEQSFIQMLVDEQLRPGMYYTVSPCFRDEPVCDDLHHLSFMKLELVVVNQGDCSLAPLEDATAFFTMLGADLRYVGMGEDQVDITWKSVEIGSYGHRTHTLEDGRFIEWSYGTGLAEPRFSYVRRL